MHIELNRKEKFEIEVVLTKRFKNCTQEEKENLRFIGFSGREGEAEFIGKKLFVGLDGYGSEDIKIAVNYGIQKLQKTKFQNILFRLVESSREYLLKDLMEGILLGSYIFEKYKSNKISKAKEISIDTTHSKKDLTTLEKEFKESLSISKSVNMVRDIVNTPPQDFFPKTMAEKAEEIAEKNSLQCKIYGEEYLITNGMHAMESVGRASVHESQLIHLTYKPKNPKKVVVIVGKGVTYDSGGLSLKSPNAMVSMKCDKSGACAVLGVMNSLKDLNLNIEVHGIIGAVENMVGGDAFKPDDIITAKNGKTVEVKSTDAEGRLVLADVLCYAQERIKNIDYIFDIATLTGATIIGLGEYTTGVMGHSKKCKKRVQKASKSSGELVGFLPFNRYLKKMLHSNAADMQNSTQSKAGSAITAAMFLDNFIEKKNKKKWLHLDIAGASYRDKNWGYNPYGGTGAGVRLLLEFLRSL